MGPTRPVPNSREAGAAIKEPQAFANALFLAEGGRLIGNDVATAGQRLLLPAELRRMEARGEWSACVSQRAHPNNRRITPADTLRCRRLDGGHDPSGNRGIRCAARRPSPVDSLVMADTIR
jgi:hypothetical protein